VNVYGAAVTANRGSFASNSVMEWLLARCDEGRSDFRDFEADLIYEADGVWRGTSQPEYRRYRGVRRRLKSCGYSRRRLTGLPWSGAVVVEKR
jgi:hypothetical protein